MPKYYYVSKLLTASFDVDPQKGFTTLCPNELPVKDGHLIGEELNRQSKFANYRFVSKDCHVPGSLWIAENPNKIMTSIPNGGKEVDVYWPMHCQVGTYGNELLDSLPNEKDYNFIVYKGLQKDMHPYGACYHDLSERISTGILEFIYAKSIESIIIGGLAFDFCVKATALQIKKEFPRRSVYVNYAATKSVNPELDHLTFEEFERNGIIVINSSKQLSN